MSHPCPSVVVDRGAQCTDIAESRPCVCSRAPCGALAQRRSLFRCGQPQHHPQTCSKASEWPAPPQHRLRIAAAATAAAAAARMPVLGMATNACHRSACAVQSCLAEANYDEVRVKHP